MDARRLRRWSGGKSTSTPTTAAATTPVRKSPSLMPTATTRSLVCRPAPSACARFARPVGIALSRRAIGHSDSTMSSSRASASSSSPDRISETFRLEATRSAVWSYDDANNNGVIDPKRCGSERGFTVYLDLNNNNQLDAGEPDIDQHADDSGRLCGFTSLASGTYQLREVPLAGWNASAPGSAEVDVTIPPQGAIVNFGNTGRRLDQLHLRRTSSRTPAATARSRRANLSLALAGRFSSTPIPTAFSMPAK